MRVLDLPRLAARRVQALARSSGAGESGLADLVGLHALHSTGDALVAAALAGTLFFSVPVGQARGRVALYLLLTMAPFAVVAPVVGPVLDRLRRGRRLALGGSMALRGVLAVAMARWYTSIELYPAAFGVLVLSKGYAVARGAVVPRLLPPRITLVAANARLTFTALLVSSIAAPVGLGLGHLLGPTWPLGLAAVVFTAAAVAGLRLPARVDVRDEDEYPPPGRIGSRPARPPSLAETVPLPVLAVVGAAVVNALWATAALRTFVGFLTMFLAFLLRAQGAGNAGIGMLALIAAAGSLAGTWAGARLPPRAPESLLTAVLAAATAAAALGAWQFTWASGLAAAFVGSLAAGLGKLALDAVIQRDTAEQVRASAFARSETVVQLAWVIGGVVGIALPLDGRLGFGVATAGLVVALGMTLRSRHYARAADPGPSRPVLGPRGHRTR
jgi:hypothetical protein